MARAEFPRKIRAAVFLRAGGCCEDCGAKLKTSEGEYDHILPCALGGDNSADNCALKCVTCHKQKTADDVRRIRKADRQRDKHDGTFKKAGRPIPGSKRSGWKKKLDGTAARR